MLRHKVHLVHMKRGGKIVGAAFLVLEGRRAEHGVSELLLRAGLCG
jgi:hypothetical protein